MHILIIKNIIKFVFYFILFRLFYFCFIGNKVLEEKIRGVQEQNEGLVRENKSLNLKIKKLIKNKENYQDDGDDYEEEEEVQAKPQLFGPIDTGKF